MQQYRYSGDMFRKMCDLSAQANPSEIFVGWYSVGSDLTLFTKVVKDILELDSLIKGQAVYLLVDESFNTGAICCTAYARVPVGVSCTKSPGTMCIPVTCTVKRLDKFTNDR